MVQRARVKKRGKVPKGSKFKSVVSPPPKLYIRSIYNMTKMNFKKVLFLKLMKLIMDFWKNFPPII